MCLISDYEADSHCSTFLDRSGADRNEPIAPISDAAKMRTRLGFLASAFARRFLRSDQIGPNRSASRMYRVWSLIAAA
jgi:hypothetical protein